MVEFNELLALRNNIQTGAAQAGSQCLSEMCAHRLSLQHSWKGSIVGCAPHPGVLPAGSRTRAGAGLPQVEVGA